MTADPTWTTEHCRRRGIRVLGLILTLGCTFDVSAGGPANDVRALQDLGVELKLAVDRAESGLDPQKQQIAEFQRALASARDAGASSDLAGKRIALERLLSKLEYLSANPQRGPALSSDAGHTRRNLDVQTLSPGHGGTCKTALGISESAAVQVVLSPARAGGAGAWFRFDAEAGAHYRIGTVSSGPDPKLEVFDSCAGNNALGANDDDLGLDATVVAGVNEQRTLMIHLTNSGRGGPATLSVTDVNGTISGTIRDATTLQAINGANVVIFSSYGNYWTSTFSDQLGNYSVPLSPGDYYVRAYDDSHRPVLYPNVVCTYPTNYYTLVNCDTALAQLIHVASAAGVQDADLTLPHGRRIEGSVRDLANQPLSASMDLYTAAGTYVTEISSDTFGRYVFTPVPPGTYKLIAYAAGYGKQMFDQVACGGPLSTQCNLATALSIDVTASDASAINFNVPMLATIQGTVFGSGDQPLQGYGVFVVDGFGNLVGQNYYTYVNPYRVGPLDPGTYYVYTTQQGYFSQIFEGLDCVGNCASQIPSATPLTIDHLGQVAQADFHLTQVPTVHGHVQDAVSGLPLSNVLVQASPNPPASFNVTASATTDALGDYALSGLQAGAYYVWAQSADHVDQVYPGITCEQSNYFYYYAPCDVSAATLLNLAPGQAPPAFNFSLTRSSGIRGTATANAGPGSDLPAHVGVDVYTGAGIAIASTSTDTTGNYAIDDLPPGTYYVSAGSSGPEQYVSQLWQHIDCPDGCPATTGTALIVGQSTVLEDIDFLLVRRSAIVGRIVDKEGAPIGGVLVDLFNATTAGYNGTGVSDAQGYYGVAPNNSGSAYIVATDSGGAYVDQIYSGTACPDGAAYFGLCSLASGTPIAITSFNTQPTIVNFKLNVAGTIFSNGFEP